MTGCDGQHCCSALWHPAEPVIQLAQARYSRCSDGHGCRVGCRFGIRNRALQNQVQELQRLLGKKTIEDKILKEALEIATGQKTSVAPALVSDGWFSMTAVCETLDVARSNIAERVKQLPSKARGRPPLADHDPVDEIEMMIADMLTYGYHRVHAILRCNAKY